VDVFEFLSRQRIGSELDALGFLFGVLEDDLRFIHGRFGFQDDGLRQLEVDLLVRVVEFDQKLSFLDVITFLYGNALNESGELALDDNFFYGTENSGHGELRESRTRE